MGVLPLPRRMLHVWYISMDDYPETLAELESRFSTEGDCRRYLAALRWADGFQCPGCGHERCREIQPGLRECCACGRQTSVTAGTIFAGTRKPLVLWFRVIWWVTGQKNGASALGLQRALGIGCYKTAWSWLRKLRLAMVRLQRFGWVGLSARGHQGHRRSGGQLLAALPSAGQLA